VSPEDPFPKKPLKKPWGGRFSDAADPRAESFGASVGFDSRLYRQDITASVAHARMLAETGILRPGECERIVAGLEEIRAEIEQGRFAWREELEDVHMNIEAGLAERIGALAGKLHTARSRNDQVATDLRLYLREETRRIEELLRRLMAAVAERAGDEADTLMPGMTHLQAAQPVTCGHHLMAWYEMLARDRGRLLDCLARLDVLPLGAAALAGTGFPIDRQRCAELLGFRQVARNSMDAVSDRDFCVEFAAACSLLMAHLSRFSEEIVLWMSPPFGFVELPERYCTGSSIMPQKKNPDLPELVRGKTGRVYGHLVALLTLIKAQPLAYNRDNQEDKEPVFDIVDTVRDCLRVYADLVPALRFRRERMREAAAAGDPEATELADYLGGKGMPFRAAHAAAGRAVREAMAQGKTLAGMGLAGLRQFSEHIAEDLFPRLDLERIVTSRDHIGGTAPARVREAARRARAFLAAAAEEANGAAADAPGDTDKGAPKSAAE